MRVGWFCESEWKSALLSLQMSYRYVNDDEDSPRYRSTKPSPGGWNLIVGTVFWKRHSAVSVVRRHIRKARSSELNCLCCVSYTGLIDVRT